MSIGIGSFWTEILEKTDINVFGILITGLLIFLPAGTLAYPGGWILMEILFVPMVIAGFVLMVKNPELLRKCLNAKEKQAEQTLVIKLSGLMFVGGFVSAGVQYRFGWLLLPKWVSFVAALLFFQTLKNLCTA